MAEGEKVGTWEGGKGQEAPAEGFSDPVVRCTECQRLITRAEIQVAGCCPDCGCRRVRNVLTLKDDEMARAKAEWPEFAAIFEPKAPVAVCK